MYVHVSPSPQYVRMGPAVRPRSKWPMIHDKSVSACTPFNLGMEVTKQKQSTNKAKGARGHDTCIDTIDRDDMRDGWIMHPCLS